VKLQLYKGGSALCTIISSTKNDGSYLWTVDDCRGGFGSDYRIRVTDTGNTNCYDYSGFFTIAM
jgi:hypothetical protein